MKVYVYTKTVPCKRLEVIKSVINIIESEGVIRIYTENDMKFYSTKHVKTRIYQN